MPISYKKRYLTAVRLEQPDTFPIDPSFMDFIHVVRILGKNNWKWWR